MITIVVNPIAGGAGPAAARARVELARSIARETPEAEVVVTGRRGHATELARDAVARGAGLVIAWGGDGTVNEVGAALIGSGAALGIVPDGSGNGLARELGAPRDARRAVARAAAAAPRAIDAGECGGRVFFSVAGIGFDAHVAACFDRAAAGSRGLSSYVRITAREMIGYRCGGYRIAASRALAPPADASAGEAPDFARQVPRALVVTFANSAQFGNGARIAPGAVLDDGLLDMVVFEERSRLATMLALPRLFTGGVRRLRGVSTERIARATVESDAAMTFHVDGEPVPNGLCLEVRVLPGALRVAV